MGSMATCTSGICSSVPVANIKTGYYRNIGVTATTEAVYIKCEDDSSTPPAKVCTAITIISTDAANGDIFVDSATPTKFKLGLDGSVTVELNSDGSNDGQYFVEVKTNTNNIFGKITSGTYYVLVDIDHGSVTLHSKGKLKKNIFYYKYLKKNYIYIMI